MRVGSLWPSPSAVARTGDARGSFARAAAVAGASMAVALCARWPGLGGFAGLAFVAVLFGPGSRARGGRRGLAWAALACVATASALAVGWEHLPGRAWVFTPALALVAGAFGLPATHRGGDVDRVSAWPRVAAIAGACVAAGGLVAAGVVLLRAVRGRGDVLEAGAWLGSTAVASGLAAALRRAHTRELALLARPDAWSDRPGGVHVPADAQRPSYRVEGGSTFAATRAELLAARDDVRVTHASAALAAVLLAALPPVAVLLGARELDMPPDFVVRIAHAPAHGVDWRAEVDAEGRVRWIGGTGSAFVGYAERRLDPRVLAALHRDLHADAGLVPEHHLDLATAAVDRTRVAVISRGRLAAFDTPSDGCSDDGRGCKLRRRVEALVLAAFPSPPAPSEARLTAITLDTRGAFAAACKGDLSVSGARCAFRPGEADRSPAPAIVPVRNDDRVLLLTGLMENPALTGEAPPGGRRLVCAVELGVRADVDVAWNAGAETEPSWEQAHDATLARVERCADQSLLPVFRWYR